MKKTILLFLRGEAAKKDAPTYHSLDTYLLKMYPNASGKEVKTVLLELQREGLATISGSWNSLGARFAGVEQTLKQVTVHAHLTPKGLEAAEAFLYKDGSAQVPVAHVPTPPVTPGLPPKLPTVPELPKAPVTPPVSETQKLPDGDMAHIIETIEKDHGVKANTDEQFSKEIVAAVQQGAHPELTVEDLKTAVEKGQLPGVALSDLQAKTETVKPSLTTPEIPAPTVPVVPNSDGLDDL